MQFVLGGLLAITTIVLLSEISDNPLLLVVLLNQFILLRTVENIQDY